MNEILEKLDALTGLMPNSKDIVIGAHWKDCAELHKTLNESKEGQYGLFKYNGGFKSQHFSVAYKGINFHFMETEAIVNALSHQEA